MYRQFNQRRQGRRNFNRFGGSGFRSGRKIKSFDPTDFINSPQVRTEIEKYVVNSNFSDFPIPDRLKENILQKGYKIPTPIQDRAILPIIQRKDLIGIANTGTGKTAAFLIPLIDKAFKSRSQKILIVTPTRELAVQIRDEFQAFSKGLGIYSALCIGGANIRKQINDLGRNPNFVIGTPGRIQDLVRSKHLNLSIFGSVVLDEADRMVDIGFIQNVRDIVSLLPKDRQSLFFCATIDGKVREILQSFVKNPVTVSVKTGETVENISQYVIKVGSPNKKIEKLYRLLVMKEFEKVLVFGRTKHGVQRLSDELANRGFRVDAIHGNKRQSQRIKTLEKFKANVIRILIATDVASRGLDIPNVSHVINYDLPESYETYIHRIGRTGRADKKGVALTFID